MYLEGTRLVLSPTDLVGFTSCAHLSELSVEVANHRLTKPQRDDPQLELVQRRGMDHERRYLAHLQQAGLGVTEISGSFEQSVADTLDILKEGPDVIYQAAFLDETGPGPAWRGHADFLRRVPRSSRLGDFSYEPEDTKLARHIKPGAVLQLCDYAAHLERLTGVAPEEIHVVLGGQTMESLRLLDYAAYYRATKARFEAALAAGVSAYPTPVSHCSICVWRERCDSQRVADDHLSLVAGMRAEQARKLEAAGVSTTAALAGAPVELEVPRLAASAYEKLHQQARLQVQARSNPTDPPPYELLPATEPGRGLRALPAPSPGDLFFDIEGDPFFESEGLEYLFGFGWVEPDGRFAYRAFWGTSRDEEKRAFEELIDFIQARRAMDPSLHVYHYAPYEPSALQRLMGRHGTRREDIDELLRADVLVDLLQVVRQSARIGVPSYGLKKIEALFMTPRSGDITDGGSSIVEFERWLESTDQSILDSLESYNRDDCESTRLLRDWLEGLRRQYEREFGAEPERPGPKEGGASDSVAEEAALNAALAEALARGAAPGAEGEASVLLAQLLEWHRDEEKPEWWKYFERIFDLDEEGLFYDSEAVTGLEPVDVDPALEPDVFRYQFVPDQEHKLAVGKTWIDPDAHRRRLEGERVVGLGKIVAVDPVHGLVDLQRTSRVAAIPRSLIPTGPVPTKAQRDALRRVATSVIEHGMDGAGPFRATRDLLLRRPPRLIPSTLAGLGRLPDETAEAAVVRLAGELDRGTLAVQGPPGSGKTRTAADTIAALVRQGKKVGVTASSHAVIANLLSAVAECAERQGEHVAISQKAGDDEKDACEHDMVTVRKSNEQMVEDLDTANVLAGTGWLFSRQEFTEQLDYLVIDEAAQLSLANVIAVSTSARNLIMVGDPTQLSQPSKAAHPPGVDVSALGHLLGDAATMPPDLGVFLDHTHRLHPSICTFVSETFYDGRLSSLPGCELQAVVGDDSLSGSGLRWLGLDHSGNRTSSIEEAEAVQQILDTLIGRQWVDRSGQRCVLGADDILVVAPYNAQVSLLGTTVTHPVQIGTVDKFQGRQAAVVIVSMAASSPEGIHRGMEFLYSRNRLNVAVSRAQAMSIVVGSPALLSAQCRTVAQMRLVNAFCRFVELATPIPAV